MTARPGPAASRRSRSRAAPLERLVLHVGQDKAGSTSLQETVIANAQALNAAGLAVATIRPDRVAHELGAHDAPFRLGPAWRALVREMGRTGCRVGLFSAEGLSRLEADEAAATLAAFARLAERVDVLLYLRHPVHFANSAISQRLRFGSTLAAMYADPPVRRLDTLCAVWAQAVAAAPVPSRLVLRAYGRDTDDGWSLVDDALDVCGVPEAVRRRLPAMRANRGFSVLAAHLLDWINRQPREAALHPSSLRAFNMIDGPRFAIPAEVCERVRDRAAPVLERLAKEHAVSLAAGPHVPSAPPQLSEAEIASLARLILMTSQYAFEVEHSRVGRWFGLWPPVRTREPVDRVHGLLRTGGLLGLIEGPAGGRARTVEKRIIRPIDDAAQRSRS